ncbi:sodium:calcium antiporter [candidate division KSB1 bacterium]
MMLILKALFAYHNNRGEGFIYKSCGACCCIQKIFKYYTLKTLMIIQNLLLFIVWCVVLVVSGTLLVKSLSKISYFLKLTEFVTAFIIMGVSTSLPELFVGITASIAKDNSIALGTVIGSNIADLSIVLGISVLLAGQIKFEYSKVKSDATYMFFIALLPMVLMFLGNGISRIDGAILVAVFIAYSYRLIRTSKAYKKELEEKVKRWSIVGYVFLFIACIVGLMYSANSVVNYGTKLSIDLLVPPIFIGIFFIAIGTSLPELVFNVVSIRKGHAEFALGDIMGSVIANSVLVLGVTALIWPITANFFLFFTSAAFMIFVCLIFLTYVWSSDRLFAMEGIALVMFYILFLIVELNLKGYF